MIQYQGEMFTQVLVKDALKVYYDFNSDNFDTTKYSIGGVIFTHKELQPFCDDIERFILYTCYFTRFDIDFSFIVKTMVRYKVFSYKKSNLDHICPDRIDMEFIKHFCLDKLEKAKEKEELYEEETEDKKD